MTSTTKKTLIIIACMLTIVSGAIICAYAGNWANPRPASECIEADGEPCDDDPLDLDDLHKTSKPVKPAASPAKPRPLPSRR